MEPSPYVKPIWTLFFMPFETLCGKPWWFFIQFWIEVKFYNFQTYISNVSTLHSDGSVYYTTHWPLRLFLVFCVTVHYLHLKFLLLHLHLWNHLNQKNCFIPVNTERLSFRVELDIQKILCPIYLVASILNRKGLHTRASFLRCIIQFSYRGRSMSRVEVTVLWVYRSASISRIWRIFLLFIYVVWCVGCVQCINSPHNYINQCMYAICGLIYKLTTELHQSMHMRAMRAIYTPCRF